MSSTTAIQESTTRRRYFAENRRLLHKRSRVFKSSHGSWEYEALVTYGQRMQRLAEERKRAEESAEAQARQKLRQLALERKRAKESAESQAAEKSGKPTQSPRKVA